MDPSMTERTETTGDSAFLFNRYLAVVNEAIAKHRYYRMYVATVDRLLRGRPLAFEVYRDDPNEVHTIHLVRIEDKRFVPVTGTDHRKPMTFKVPEAHLHDVVENRALYVRRPFRLDLDWARARVGHLIRRRRHIDRTSGAEAAAP